MSRTFLQLACSLAAFLASASIARAAEHITLANGFEVLCLRHEAMPETGKVRLYPMGAANADVAGYLELPTNAIRFIEFVEDAPAAPPFVAPPPSALSPGLAAADIHTLLATAGVRRNIDVDLLTSLVHAESGGHPQAISRAGARGLMQLMPATAASLGVQDAFRPEQNIAGGTAYLDQLLTRYHDDLALALAAYNAGPAAVDRFHGVPPFRETRAYVTRIINEFNRRKRLALQAAAQTVTAQAATQLP